MVIGLTANAAGDTILIFDDFSQGTLDPQIWDSASHGIIENGSLKIMQNKWPTLKLPELETDASYELSYKIMATAVDPSPVGFRAYGTGSQQMNFGTYRAGVGFARAYNIFFEDNSPIAATNVNVWYTIKTEFSKKAGARYNKFTILDENGNVLWTETKAGLWNGSSKTLFAENDPVEIKGIYFYNEKNEGVPYYVDDVMFVKLAKPTVKLNIIYEQNFDNVANIAALQADGKWSRATGVQIVNGTLEVPPDAYIYLNLDNKKENTAYKMTYDIMTPTNGNGNGGLNFYFEGNPSWSLGYFNAVNGLACVKHNHNNKSQIISGTQAGRWYTVKVEFYESATNGYIIYTLIDRETQEVLGTYAPPVFEASDAATIITTNYTKACIWNRNGSTETYYIDNIKLEIQGEKPVFKADEVIIRDLVGNEITDLTAPVTPGIANIILDFTTEVTQESAENGVELIECNQYGNEVAVVPISGVVEGSKYIISLSELLKENTKYIIKISKSIMTEEEEKLNKDFTVEFNTGRATSTIELDGIYLGDTKITDFEQIGTNVPITVKAKALNTTKNSIKVAVCVSYFCGHKMVCTALEEANVPALSGEIIEKIFTTPNNMMEIDSIQVLIWDSAVDMFPYCNTITLSR